MRLGLLVVPLICLALFGCQSSDGSAKNSPAPQKSKLTKLVSEDVKKGSGDGAQEGDIVYVRYTGKLENGKVFDSNEGNGKPPMQVRIGAGAVIKGWEEGLVGMKEGGERKLSIPSDLAYGEQSPGNDIPPNADLYFDVKLLKIIKAEDSRTVQIETIKEGTGPAAKKGDKVGITFKVTDMEGNVTEDSKSYGKGPVTFTIGKGEAQDAIDESVVGMKVGGVRKLTIPPDVPMGLPMGPEQAMVKYYTITLVSLSK